MQVVPLVLMELKVAANWALILLPCSTLINDRCNQDEAEYVTNSVLASVHMRSCQALRHCVHTSLILIVCRCCVRLRVCERSCTVHTCIRAEGQNIPKPGSRSLKAEIQRINQTPGQLLLPTVFELRSDQLHLLSLDRHDAVFLCFLLGEDSKTFNYFNVKSRDTYPVVQAWLVHALGVLLQFELLAVDAWALDVGRQVRHVGDPGHGALVGRGRGVEGGWRLGALGREAGTLNMRT